MIGLLKKVYRFFVPVTRDVDSIIALLVSMANELESYSDAKLVEHDDLYNQAFVAEREARRAGRISAALHNLCK